MDVQVSGGKARWGDLLVQLSLAALLVATAVAPGFLWPPYFRILSTLLLIGLGLVVGRAYLAAFTTFRRPHDPPPKPAGVSWPKVSVLVPAYNEALVLPRTMESMLGIDYPAEQLEFVYVYERRSTDGTAALIRSFAARDPRFRAIERDDRRGGKAAATNFGLAHCTGEIVLSLDADHAVRPDAVQRAVRHFLADPKVMCVKGRAIGINGRESFLALQTKLERDAIEKGDLYMRHVLGGFTFFGGGQAFFRRSVFEGLGTFDEEILVEDIDFSVQIHKAGYRLVVDPRIETYEENPARLADWWAQRKRWSRGWMQVTMRYLPRIHHMGRLGWRQRLDLYHTLAYVLVPIFFVVGLPLAILGQTGYDTSDYLQPWSAWLWVSYAAAPAIVWMSMWLQDRRDGVRHEAREWLGLPFLWGYLVFQTGAFWSAFLEEFVLRRPSVYVKTSKTGGRAQPLAPPVPALQPAERMLPAPPVQAVLRPAEAEAAEAIVVEPPRRST